MQIGVVSSALFDKMSETAESALRLARELDEEIKVLDTQITNLNREIERLKEENELLKKQVTL